MQYAIHESNIARIRREMSRLGRKSYEAGCDISYKEVRTDFRPSSRGLLRYVVVEVSGVLHRPGWQAIAILEFENSGTLVHPLISSPPAGLSKTPCRRTRFRRYIAMAAGAAGRYARYVCSSWRYTTGTKVPMGVGFKSYPFSGLAPLTLIF